MAPDVALVVVTYRRPRLLARCLEAVLSGSVVPGRVVVVDNASTLAGRPTDDVCDVLENVSHPGLVVAAPGHNHGYAAGINHGADVIAAGPSPTWLWVLDDDSVPHPDALEALLATGTAAADVVAVTPHGGRLLWYGLRWDDVDDGGPAEDRDFGLVDGCLVRWSTFQAAGRMTDDLFLMYEDVDLSLRLAAHGRVVSLRRPDLVHRGEVGRRTAERGHNWRAFYQHRNELRTAARRRDLGHVVAALLRLVGLCGRDVLRRDVRTAWLRLRGSTAAVLGPMGRDERMDRLRATEEELAA